MLCHALTLILIAQITHTTRTYVTSSPLIATIDRIREKLENLTVEPTRAELSEEEEVLSAIQAWGTLTPEQLNAIAKDFQRVKEDDEHRRRLSDLFYEDNDEEYADVEYRNDGEDEVDEVYAPDSLTKTKNSYTLVDNGSTDSDTQAGYRGNDWNSPVSQRPEVISAVEAMAATNKRPQILVETDLTPKTQDEIRKLTAKNMERVFKEIMCKHPQRKWLTVSDLLPGSNLIPNYVDLHRCTHVSGCCLQTHDICAPIDGRLVVQHFYDYKDGSDIPAVRVVFYNHTKCGCVDRHTLRATNLRVRVVSSTPAPVQATIEPKSEEDATKLPQTKRCTCPTPFLASTQTNGGCICGCTWRDVSHRHDCQYIARGKEHLGLRDRVCIEHGDCEPPACEYGSYDAKKGKCPKSMKKRDRFHEKRLHQERNVV